MRGRLVLLDDEDPGADTADRELLVALDARLLGRDGGASDAISASTASGRPSAWTSPVGRTQPMTPESRATRTTAAVSTAPSTAARTARLRPPGMA